ncbi:ankyrin repeat domain-containing protein [Lacihabitans sp. LS3-19]|uniref:ankyrin repeat domain-containing protein n=1 Tax=Lacihabitans sp. LS3-19 TaxID=2487335 RepID=UPI0020CDCF54|nr:ankyrin repeat domain-containing protein [Lacihabitans sp. LS3-19]MCP9767552.1 ankyrin repeat domain-containing protein [Lacihabitans sp. LS3-19]
MEQDSDILYKIEVHDADGLRESFRNGLDPNGVINGEALFLTMINMYMRSPRFKECISAFVENGLEFSDKLLISLLQDKAEDFEKFLDENPEKINQTYDFDCTFCPLYGASLLHICAEYNLIACAKALIAKGFDINTKAGIDENGFGRQTPIFHTVNQNLNQSKEMFELLMKHNVDLEITIPGLIWGKGYELETFVPSVNPISFALMGLLPQFHRKDSDIYWMISVMMKKRYEIDYLVNNIPNKYLQS